MAVKRGRAAAFSVFKNKKKENKKTGASSKPQSSASSKQKKTTSYVNRDVSATAQKNIDQRASSKGRENRPSHRQELPQRRTQAPASNRVAQSQESRANTPTASYQRQRTTAATSAEMRNQRGQINQTQKGRVTASTADNMRRQQEYEKMAEERKQNLSSRREDKTSRKDYERANFERSEQVVEAGKKATKAITKAAKNFKNLDSTNYTQGVKFEDDRDFGTDVAKSFKHGFKEAAISTRAAGERVWRNSLKSGRPMELSRQSGDWTESEEEKKFYKNQISKSELRQVGLREKIKEEQAKIHELESKQDSTLAKWAMGAASSGGGMAFDRLTGPMSLLTMGVRVTEGARGDVTDKADALKKEMLSSGNYSQEEVDELFKDVNKWDLANALGQGSLEALSELTFGGIGAAAKYTPAGGILDKAVGKLTGRLGSTAIGRLGLGVSEEIAEEEIGNPLQTMWSNRIYGDKLQAMQEDSIRRAYSKEADTLEDNLATSENINSEEFLEQSKALYKKTGASDEEAEKLALMARDYFNARIEGDEKAEEDAMNKIVETLAGGENSLQEKWTMSDAANVAGSTAIMTGLTGLPSVMTTSQKGNEYRQNYGIQGVKNIAKVVENLDSQNSPRAKAVLESIEKGKEPTGTQIYNLITWSNKAVNEAKDLEVARDRDVQARMKQEKLYAPIVDADYNLAPATEERFEDIVEKTIDTIKSLNLNMDEAEMYPLADVVAAYETGTITSEQLNELNIESPENRKAFESATGINLDEYTVKDKKGNIDEAASNIEMHKALFAKSTENYMTSARIEQEAWNDEARVEMANSLSSNMLSGGSVAVQNALKTVDPMDRGKFMLTGSAVRSVYEEARFRNTSWEDVSKTLKDRFPGVDKEVLHNVFNEAKTDRSMDEDANYGKQVKAGEPMDKKSLKDSAPVRVPGKVIDLRENPTNNLSSLSFITSAAKVFGVNIQLTDNLVARDSKGNEVLDNKGNPLQVEGTQSGTTILINTNDGILRAADDIAKHELIHQIRTNAPEEFKVFARLAMDRMHRANPEEFKKSIQSKQEQYKSVDENMTPEAAFEEMIANGSVALDWEQLIADVQTDNTIQNKSRLLEAIKNAVAEVLRKLRSMLSMDNAIDDEDVRTAVIDEIMQQQDVYDLLVRAASEAKATESAEKFDLKQNEINARSESKESLSLSDDNFIVQGKTARWTDERIDRLTREYGASRDDYSKAYAVLMNPRDFLKLTITDEELNEWNEKAKTGESQTYRPLSKEDIADESQTPFLRISSSEDSHEPFHQVTYAGHEGRHRMRALMEAGVESVPVVVLDLDTKYSKKNENMFVLQAEDWGEGRINDNAWVRVRDLVPIRGNNRDELIEKFGGEADIRFSISEQQDADYMKAIEDGDMETAQRMVDEAAAKAMPNTATPGRWFHGTENDFTVFDFSQGGKNGAAEGFGIYLARDKDVSEHYGKRMIEGYANIEHPASDTERTLSKDDLVSLIKATVDQEAERLAEDYDGDVEAAKKDTWISNYTYTYDKSLDASIGEVADSILDMNENDKDIIQEVMAGMAIRNYSEAEKFYDILTDLTGIDGFTTTWENIALEGTRDIALAFRSEQIKDSSPVTYDDNGDVIPLSERFDMQNPDIRYSISEEDRAELNDAGVDITEGGSAVRYSYNSWEGTDKKELLDKLVAAGFERDVAKKWIEEVNTVASIIFGDMGRLNYEADQFQDALKSNSEYYYTLDLSTLCQKRRLYQGSYNAIMDKLVNTPLHKEDTVRLRQMMDEMGHETPCGICYEESRKKMEGTFAERWLNGYGKWKGYANTKHDDPYVPTLADVTTTTGRKRLRDEGHTEALESYLKYQRTRDSANPKVSFTHTDYRRDILRMTKTDVENVKHIGGLRIQSFSDFETVHVIDMMQAIMDMATMKLTSQAYTKVPAFADIFGGTGVKINLSLIQKMDENGKPIYDSEGKLVFDSKEGIDPDEAFRIREKYSENVGTILVGVSEEQILSAWADPRVDMVIPFHRSGWSLEEFEKLGLKGYEDFQEYQSEKIYDSKSESWITLDAAKKAKLLDSSDELYSADYWDYSKTGKENAERYLELCAEQNRRPVFYNFLHDNGDGTWSLQEDGSTDGYWKSLIDFKMYDNEGKGAPQVEVQPNFDMEAAQKVMGEYEGNADTLPIAEDVVEEFVKEYAEKHPDVEIADARLSISARLDEPYMKAVESNNTEEAQRLVEEAAKSAGYNSPKVYHGSPVEYNFTTFVPNAFLTEEEGDNQIKGYFSEDRSYSENYGDVREFYVRINNPLEFSESEKDKTIEEWVKWFESKGVPDVKLDSAIEKDSLKGADYGDGRRVFGVWEIFDSGAYWNGDGNLTTKIKEAGFDGLKWDYGEKAWIPFDDTAIKSADTVTYAEDGSIIPLSERFNPESNDIRYSMPTQDSEGKVLTDGQMEYFKNSQARDEQGRLVPVYHTTNKGGFTVFDPYKSDDHRSLFFASNFDVSQTYGRNANNSIDIENAGFTTWESFEQYANENFADYPNWDTNKSMVENLDVEITPLKKDAPDITFEEWLKKKSKHTNYEVKLKIPKEDGNTYHVNGDGVTGLLRDISGVLGKIDSIQKGYYKTYLNLENPMIVDAKGANWNRIPYGELSTNPIREQTLEYINEDAAFRVDSVAIEYDDFDDNFDGGQFRKLVFDLHGAKKSVNGEWLTWEEQNEFEVDEDAVISGDEYAYENLQNQLSEYWTSIGLSVDYLFEVMDHSNDFTGGVHYTPATDTQALTEDYLDLDGEKYSYEELFEEFNDEAGMNYSPYEGIETGRRTYRTRELAELAQTQGNDGVIIKNCVDIGAASTLLGNHVSDIYIAFSSNQVKDVDNQNPTENPDIRYSIVDDDEVKARQDRQFAYDNSYEALMHYEEMFTSEDASEEYDLLNDKDVEAYYRKAKRFVEKDVDAFYSGLTPVADRVVTDDPVLEEGRVRMARSKEDFFNSNIAKWNDRWLTDGTVLDVESVKKEVRDLVMAMMQNSDTDRQYKTGLVNKTLIDMRLAYDYAKRGQTDIASAILWHSAQKMIDNVEFYREDDSYATYKDLRDYLRTTKISLGSEYWSDVAGGEFGRFRKKNYGRLKLVKGSTDVDQIYQELEERWPEWFDTEEQMTPPDMLEQISHVLDVLQPVKEAYSSEEAAEVTQYIAEQLTDIMDAGKELHSLADDYKKRLDEKTKAMKLRHEEAMRKVREQRDKGIKAEKAKWQVKEEKRKERASHKKAFKGIEESYKTLTERLFNNTADSHIPQQYKKELAGLLACFDMQTEGSKKREARTGHVAQKTIKLSAIKTALSSIENNTQLFHINDAITDLIDELLGIKNGSPSESIDGLTIDELSVTELAKVDKLLKALVHEFNNYEKVRVGTKKQQAADIGKAQVDSALEHAKTFGSGKDYQNLPGFLDNIINLDEVTPAYMFRRIDPENNGLGLMWKEIRRSFDKYVRNQNQLNEWIDDIVGEYHDNPYFFGKYGAGELADWRSERYAKTFRLVKSNGSVTLTPAQMMSIYCLSKRAQAMDHMTGAGIVVAPVSYNAKKLRDVKKRANTALPVPLTEADIQEIISELTPEQIKVAEELQELLSTKMAQWGNEASMDVIGIELFNEKDYFPIKSDKAALTKDLNEAEFAEAIRNFGFTKAVQPGARNAIMVDDIFDVVTEHCNNMNLYNSYSATINDFMKVYNYRDFREDGTEYTVQQAIAHAYSKKATTFIMTFIRDLNGNVSGRASGIENMYNGLLANAKKAAVFANLRVAAQQPTAIMRAFAEISPKYIKGIKIEKGAMQEMFEHAPIALWKSWGYYDINMGKSIEDIMMNEGTILEDVATDLYGALDNVTWTAIWQMVKNEMKDTHPDVEIGTDEYWELCNERFSEIIDLTQVVDSPMHRSHAMRDKGFFHKMTTSFMAEPTVTFNLLKAGYVNAWEQYKLGNTKEATKIFARTNAVILLQAAAVSAAAGFVDALRGKGADDDDDDDEKSKLRRILALWEQNTFENFIDELKPYNKIYVVKDIASMFDGWDNRNLALQGFQMVSLGWRQLMGDPYARSSKSWYENFFGGFGYLTGIPVKTMMTGLENAMGLFGVSIPAIDNTKDRLDKIAELNKERRKESGEEGGYFAQLFSMVISDDKTKASANTDTETDSDTDSGSGSGSKGGMSVSYEDDAQALYDASREYDDMLADAQKAADGYEGEDRNKRIWQSVSKDYKKYMEIGDIGYLEQMRDVVEEMGGDLEYFDERMISTAKSTLKKSLSYESGDADLQARIGSSEYLRMRGVTEEEISEVCYKSEMAKDLKVAFRLGDEQLILESAQPLVDAGLTDADWEKLWKNRNRLDIKKYDGKYKDQLKSQGTFIWPTQGTITSHFGRRNAPTAGASSNHPAIDIGAATGTPVLASDGGVVISAGRNGGYGNSVGIKHDNGMVTYYNHLYGWNVKEGDVVAQGQEIGQVGSTGISTGPHLDFKILDINGNAVDPEQYLQ